VRDGVVWSIDYDEGDGLPIERDFYSPGENMAIALNTDAEKQGFEYAVYAQNFEQGNDQVRLLDYDKEFNGRVKVLQDFQANICGVRRSTISSPDAFVEGSRFYLTRLDDTAVIISLNDGACDETTNQYYRIEFVLNQFNLIDIVDQRFVSSAEAFGAHFFDPSFEQILEDVENNEEEDEDNVPELIPPGEGLWIGYDHEGKILRLRTDEGLVLAQTAFASDRMPTFTVISDKLLVIQADLNVYVIKQSELIQVANRGTGDEGMLSAQTLFFKARAV
jgi:hypothetical protein